MRRQVVERFLLWRWSVMSRPIATSLLTAATLALFSACALDEADTEDGTFSQRLASEEEAGVLRFVNDCPTTLPVLDDDAALDARAASGIVNRRDGADATCGTADDQLFASLAELDAVAWVGDSALSRLLAHATLLGYVTGAGDGIVGEYDGVPFDAAEAAGVLAIVNGASLEILDDDIGLDARAALAIIEARPFAAAAISANMQALAATSYVGKSALQRLKAYVEAWSSCTTASTTVKNSTFSSLEAHDTLDLLNQAPLSALKSISGIGNVLAGRIDYARPFENLAQLAAIDGLGQAVVENLRVETGVRWCPLVGARCGCPAGASYRPPFVAFDENGLYYFVAYGEDRWQGERVVDAGFLSHDGEQVVMTDVQVPNDPDQWQGIAVEVFDTLWSCCLRHRYDGEPLEIGRLRQGVLYLGRVINAHDGKPYVMAYWRDIDDGSLGWLFEQDSGGAWVQAGEVFLN